MRTPTEPIIAAALLALSATALSAQAPAYQQRDTARVPAQMLPQAAPSYLHRRLTGLLEGLSLTALQRARVDSIVQRHKNDAPAMAPESAQDSAMQTRWRMLIPRFEAEVRAVLTAEQQQTFDRNRTRMRSGAS